MRTMSVATSDNGVRASDARLRAEREKEPATGKALPTEASKLAKPMVHSSCVEDVQLVADHGHLAGTARDSMKAMSVRGVTSTRSSSKGHLRGGLRMLC